MTDEIQPLRIRSTESTWDVYMTGAETACVLVAADVKVSGIHSNEDRAKEAVRITTENLHQEMRYGTFRCYRTDNDAPFELTRTPKVIPEHVQDEWS